jgi:hypothetical protein
MDNMNEMTVKDLQKELVKLGISEEESAKFTVKATIIATLNALKAKESKEPEKVSTLTPSVDPKEEKQIESRWQSKADRMCDFFESQPKISIMIPCEANEKPGVVEVVMVRGRKQYKFISGGVWSKSFNGYRVIVPKGTYYDVPKSVAENIASELNQTQQAGSKWGLDRIDAETGKPVRDQLS